MKRNVALLFLCVVISAVLLCNNAHAQVTTATSATPKDEMYPNLHVRPPRNWINDPNGPFRSASTGIVHLWMQYNPYGAIWGNMSWYHVTSADYVYWQHVGVSLYNDASYDKGGVFSGSVTVLKDGGGVPVILYTCVDPSIGQIQCVATPTNTSDPQLASWQKSPKNPTIAHRPATEMGDNFRDPTTAWPHNNNSETDVYYFAIGFSARKQAENKQRTVENENPATPATEIGKTVPGGVAQVLIYSANASDLFSTMTYSNIMYTDASELSNMFECPDVFPTKPIIVDNDAAAAKLNSRSSSKLQQQQQQYVFKYSSQVDFKDYYKVGTFDSTANTFISSAAASIRHVDFGKWYASKSFWDPIEKKRIMFGWINEEDTHFAERGWAGVQSVPRAITFDAELGVLKLNALPQLAKLRTRQLSFVKNKTLTLDVRSALSLRARGVTNQIKALRSAVTILPPSGRPVFDAVVAKKGAEEAEGEEAPFLPTLQQDIDVFFEVPRAALVNSSDMAKYVSSIEIGLNVRVTNRGESVKISLFREFFAGGQSTSISSNTNFVGGDYYDFATNKFWTEEKQIEQCYQNCTTDPRCVAWTYVRAGYIGPPPFAFAPRCSMKSETPYAPLDDSCCVSGRVSAPLYRVNRQTSGTQGSTVTQEGKAFLFDADGVRVVADDSSSSSSSSSVLFHQRVIVDHSVIEAFKDDGYERIASRVYVKGVNTAGVEAFVEVVPAATQRQMLTNMQQLSVKIVNCTVWNLNSIWKQ